MKKTRAFFLILPLAAKASAEDGWPALIDELLRAPAPPADWRPHAPFRDAPPPDDAPLEVLTAYWEAAREEPVNDSAPSAFAAKRLLEAVVSDPAGLPLLLPWLPRNAEARAVIEGVIEKNGANMPPHWQEEASGWLEKIRERSDDDLATEARAASFDDGELAGEAALYELLARDRLRGRAVLDELRRRGDPRLEAFAVRLLYEDSMKQAAATLEDDRIALLGIAAGRSRPPFARHSAIKALMAADWPGLDDWFLRLFADETLLEGREEFGLLTPLAEVVAAQADRLVPKVALLAGSKERAVHDNAVVCLAQFHLENAREDALRALLPWLADPSWSSAGDRLRFILSLDRVALPESVPGLIAVLREGWWERPAAVEALAFQRDERAVPALQAALAEEEDEALRQSILQALAACRGLPAADHIAAIEAYARQLSTPEGRRALHEARSSRGRGADLDSAVSRGSLLSNGTRLSEASVERLHARARELASSEPQVSRSLLRIIARWPHEAAVRCLLEALDGERPDSEGVRIALERREWLAGRAAPKLRELAAGGGHAGGIACVLLGDAELSKAVLGGPDPSARTALLAGNRLVRASLPLDAVGALLESEDAPLRHAAEAYLTAEDGPAARELILARRPGELLILGARSSFDPGHFSFHALDEWEERLAAMMRRDDAPDEIVALLSAGYWGDAGQTILYVRAEEVELFSRIDGERYRRRALTDAEWKDLQAFLEASRFFDLPPLTPLVHDGMQYEAVRLTKAGGRRVFMNNPGSAGSAGSPYDLLVRRFQRLAAVPTSPLRYDVFDVLPGSRLLLSGEGALAVWKSERVIAVLQGDEEEASWRLLAGGELGEEVPRPADLPDEEFAAMNEAFMLYPHLNPSPWQARLGEGVVLAGSLRDSRAYAPALRWLDLGRGSEVIIAGTYAHPIVTPDGRWILAAKAGRRGWAEPNGVVRIRLEDRRELPVSVPPAETLEPVAWVPERRSVLLHRNDDRGEAPGAAEFFLCDPETGEAERASGELAPWFHAQRRPLQPSGVPGEVWAAVPGEDGTRVGRYDTKRFSFLPLAEYPRIGFTSSQMWVEPESAVIFVTNRGDLLALPFERP